LHKVNADRAVDVDIPVHPVPIQKKDEEIEFAVNADRAVVDVDYDCPTIERMNDRPVSLCVQLAT
jgi:hypothetical protein